jgi:hypothetical protein
LCSLIFCGVVYSFEKNSHFSLCEGVCVSPRLFFHHIADSGYFKDFPFIFGFHKFN